MYTTYIMCTGTSYNNYVTTANSLAASEWYRTREYTTVHLALAIAAHLVAVLLRRMEKAAVATGFYIHYTEISPNQSILIPLLCAIVTSTSWPRSIPIDRLCKLFNA